MPSPSRGSKFLLKMYTGFWIFFILGGLLGLVCENFRDDGNVTSLENMIIWSISTVW